MEKLWLKSYPEGVPAEIDLSRYQSILELFSTACENYAESKAYSNLGSSLTYKELEEKSRYFAAFLQQELGLKKGDRVAIMLPNLLQFPVAMFGAMRAGCILVNINPLYTHHELTHVLNDCGAKVLVILANFKDVLAKTLPEVELKHVILTEIADLFPAPKRVLLNFVIRHIKKMVPKTKIKGAYRFNQALHQGKKSALTPVTLTQEDVAFLQYTGGTTGVAKGAILTHRNLIANILQLEAWFKPAVGDNNLDNVVVITPLPLYHIFSLTVNCLFFLLRKSLIVLITNPRDIPNFVKTLKKQPFNIITGVNTLYNALANNPDFAKLDFSHLKLTVAGGMAVQKAVAKRWQDITGCVLIEGYGLTETSPVVTANLLDNKEFSGSIGLPIPSTEVSIRDQDHNELEIGEVGEICVRGPQVMRGYWQSGEVTERAFSVDGWLHTGDMGRIDNHGFFYVVDRIKDMINVSGFNVYPNEIEDIIAKYPGVLEVAVVGIADEHSGEVPKAFIVKKDPNLTEKDILKYCHENMTGYKVPKQVEFRDELPKTNVGKILRRALRTN
ncbi:MAG: AMP-binding protein [Pseudomonadota bacterium]